MQSTCVNPVIKLSFQTADSAFVADHWISGGVSEEIEYDDLVSNKEQFDNILGRLRKLEDGSAASTQTVQPIPTPQKQEGWIKQNFWWLSWAITILFGSGCIFGFSHWFFGDLVDHRIDDKLRQPFADTNKRAEEQGKQLASIDGRLQGISDLLKIVAQNEMKRVAALSPKDFRKNLPQVGDVLRDATALTIAAPAGTLPVMKENSRRPVNRTWDIGLLLHSSSHIEGATKPLPRCVTFCSRQS